MIMPIAGNAIAAGQELRPTSGTPHAASDDAHAADFAWNSLTIIGRTGRDRRACLVPRVPHLRWRKPLQAVGGRATPRPRAPRKRLVDSAGRATSSIPLFQDVFDLDHPLWDVCALLATRLTEAL